MSQFLNILGGGAGGGGGGGVTASGNNVFTGINSFAGAMVYPANAMAALAIDVTKGMNTKTIAVDSTFTFSGTPANDEQMFGLRVNNSDTAPHLLTIPSSFDVNGQVTITTFYIGAGNTETVTWVYDSTTTTYFAYGVPQLGGIATLSKSAAYTTIITDANKSILHPAADNNARTFTIDSNANVPYPVGTAITFINEINTLSIAITSDTLVLAGTAGATTGTRTMAVMSIATAVKKTSTSWIISGSGIT